MSQRHIEARTSPSSWSRNPGWRIPKQPLVGKYPSTGGMWCSCAACRASGKYELVFFILEHPYKGGVLCVFVAVNFTSEPFDCCCPMRCAVAYTLFQKRVGCIVPLSKLVRALLDLQGQWHNPRNQETKDQGNIEALDLFVLLDLQNKCFIVLVLRYRCVRVDKLASCLQGIAAGHHQSALVDAWHAPQKKLCFSCCIQKASVQG
jgi:hypothetical protein